MNHCWGLDSEANGGIGEPGPYRQSYQYDVWDNVIMHSNRFWSFTPLPTTATYVNDRNPAWQYDGAGNVVHTVENFTNISDSTYDAAGEMINSSQTSDGRTATISQTYDGDGQPAKRLEQRPSHTSTIYYVRSSVMGGQVVTELNAQGQKTRGYVYASGQVLAIQNVTANGSSVYWRHIEPVTENFVEINQNRAVLTVFDIDSVGAFLGTSDPFEAGASPSYDELIGDRPSHDIDADPFDTSSGCTLDGIPINCNLVMQMVKNGGAVTAPLKSAVPVVYGGERTWAFFQAFADGYEGFVPVTAKYTGKGQFKPISKTSVHMVNVRRGDLRNTNFERLNGVDPTGKEETQLAQSQTTPNRGGLPALLAAALRTAAELRKAVDLAVAALQSNPDCAALFDLPPDTNPADLLLELYGGQSQRGNIQLQYVNNPNDNAATAQRLTSAPYTTTNFQVIQRSAWAPNTGVIAINTNPQSAFNDGYRGRYGLSDSFNRAITLIHELGHAANLIFGVDSSRINQADGPGGNSILSYVSRANSLRVKEACF